MEALLDVLGAERWADGAFFDDIHRCRQRTGAQQQGGIVGFGSGHAAGDLYAAAADFGADDRGGDDFALALLDEQDGHALADILAGDVLEDTGAGRVEVEVYSGFLRLVVEAGLGIVQAVAGQHNLLLDQQRLATALVVELGTERRVARQCGIQGTRGVIHHADFQGRGTAQDVLSLGRVLHARQLDDDAILSLLLDHRLGDAEFVDPVVQRGDVLLQREFADLLLGLRLQRRDQARFAGVAGFDDLQVGLAVGNGVTGLVAGFGIAELDDDTVTLAIDAAVTQVLVAQCGADVGRSRIKALGQRALHVHLEQEVHAAAQVEAEVHRQRVQRGQPLRRSSQQVEGDDVLRVGSVRIEGLFQDVLGL